jgi:hypothetical protein
MNWQQLLAFGLKEAGLHFLFSACVGLLVFALTLTILSAVRRLLYSTAWRSIAAKSGMAIFGLALCLALFLAWDAHIWVDAWYTAPINAPLVINTDPGRYNP